MSISPNILLYPCMYKYIQQTNHKYTPTPHVCCCIRETLRSQRMNQYNLWMSEKLPTKPYSPTQQNTLFNFRIFVSSLPWLCPSFYSSLSFLLVYSSICVPLVPFHFIFFFFLLFLIFCVYYTLCRWVLGNIQYY